MEWMPCFENKYQLVSIPTASKALICTTDEGILSIMTCLSWTNSYYIHYYWSTLQLHYCICLSFSSESESGSQLPCEQLVSPTALAACMQVDSCFAPWLVPSLGVSLKLAYLELRLCHHLEQLGTGITHLKRLTEHMVYSETCINCLSSVMWFNCLLPFCIIHLEV